MIGTVRIGFAIGIAIGTVGKMRMIGIGMIETIGTIGMIAMIGMIRIGMIRMIGMISKIGTIEMVRIGMIGMIGTGYGSTFSPWGRVGYQSQ